MSEELLLSPAETFPKNGIFVPGKVIAREVAVSDSIQVSTVTM